METFVAVAAQKPPPTGSIILPGFGLRRYLAKMTVQTLLTYRWNTSPARTLITAKNSCSYWVPRFQQPQTSMGNENEISISPHTREILEILRAFFTGESGLLRIWRRERLQLEGPRKLPFLHSSRQVACYGLSLISPHGQWLMNLGK